MKKNLIVIFLMFIFSSLLLSACTNDSEYLELNSNFKFIYNADNDQLELNENNTNYILSLNDYQIVNETVPYILFNAEITDESGEKTKEIVKYPLMSETNKNLGILLSFDDYFVGNWEKYLDLFLEHNATCTWFCYGKLNRFESFALQTQEKGFEVGYHSLKHNKMKDDTWTEQMVYDECVAPLLDFYTNHIELHSFAYPGGAHKSWMNTYLSKYYDFIRLFINIPYFYDKQYFRDSKVLYSNSIDDQWFTDDNDFEKTMEKRLVITKVCKYIYPCTSHYIRDDGEDYYDNNGNVYNKYTITRKKLNFLCVKCTELKIPFLLYKDLN